MFAHGVVLAGRETAWEWVWSPCPSRDWRVANPKGRGSWFGVICGGMYPFSAPRLTRGGKSHWGPKTAFINCDVLFCVGFFFFPLNILCFLTINHILRQKAFKETGHGVCFRSLAGEAGHQLTAVINPQLSDQSIFPPTLQGREGGPRQCQPPVPCHPCTQEGHRAASCPPVVAVPSGQCPLIPGTVPSCSALS